MTGTMLVPFDGSVLAEEGLAVAARATWSCQRVAEPSTCDVKLATPPGTLSRTRTGNMRRACE
jgi:hypothetical protein